MLFSHYIQLMYIDKNKNKIQNETKVGVFSLFLGYPSKLRSLVAESFAIFLIIQHSILTAYMYSSDQYVL